MHDGGGVANPYARVMVKGGDQPLRKVVSKESQPHMG